MTATPDPVATGQTVSFGINVVNLSTNTATGNFTVQASLPSFATVLRSSTGAGSCEALAECRSEQVLSWGLPSLPPGANTMLRFAATLDNSAMNPPPPGGTLLSSRAIANVFNVARAGIDVRVAADGAPTAPTNAQSRGGAGSGGAGQTGRAGTSGDPLFGSSSSGSGVGSGCSTAAAPPTLAASRWTGLALLGLLCWRLRDRLRPRDGMTMR